MPKNKRRKKYNHVLSEGQVEKELLNRIEFEMAYFAKLRLSKHSRLKGNMFGATEGGIKFLF